MADTEADLTDAHHYESRSDMPANIQKYWHQRYDLFSRYDEGIWLTNDAWFGVTPEPVATRIASDLAQSTPTPRKMLIDLFAGAGGNTIAFAQSGRWEQIFAIERDATTLACARHNARLYGVERRIVWIQGDCWEVLRRRLKGVVSAGAVVFGSPPWGGPGYIDSEVLRLDGLEPYGLGDMLAQLEKVGARDVVLYLPRNGDLNELAAWEGRRKGRKEGPRARVTHYCIEGVSKALCVFYGDFDFKSVS